MGNLSLQPTFGESIVVEEVVLAAILSYFEQREADWAEEKKKGHSPKTMP